MIAIGTMLLSGACRKKEGKSELIIAGSTSVQPFVEMVAEKYMEEHPDLRVIVQGGGSTAGVQAVREGAAAVGMSSRNLNAQESDLTPVTLARDGIAVIVHPSNRVADLTVEQVREIFGGRIKDWKELGGAPGRIWLVTREEGSGTRGAFKELVMHKTPIVPEAIVQDSNGSVRAVIADFPMGVGYVSLGLVDASVKAVKIGGAAPTRDNVKNKSYRLVRPFLFLLKGEPQPQAKQFIDYVLSDHGQKLLEEESLIGVH
jgi:phosphate transport system substrate-binding protein